MEKNKSLKQLLKKELQRLETSAKTVEMNVSDLTIKLEMEQNELRQILEAKLDLEQALKKLK